MNNERTAGTATLILSILAAIAMIAVTAVSLPSVRPAGDLGICLPSPNIWPRFPFDIAANAVILGACIFGAMLINKTHGFIRTTDPMMPSAMAVIIASNPLLTTYLGTPTLMLAANIICLGILMGAYRVRNATHQLFAVATFLSLGSMVQYAFLPFVFIYPVLAMMIKAFRFKECMAYIMGLIAPYWVGLAFGLISPSDFSLPQFQLTLPDIGDGEDVFLMLLSLGTVAIIALLTSVNNAMLLFAGNNRIRIFNNMINTVGVLCFVCMVFDFTNVAAYASTFCFTASVQIANFFAIHRIPKSRMWFWIVLSVFIIYFLIITAV